MNDQVSSFDVEWGIGEGALNVGDYKGDNVEYLIPRYGSYTPLEDFD